jgi:hypothetical protein
MDRVRNLSATLMVAIFATLATSAAAQSSADAIPRMPDGRPDLSGTWETGRGIDFIQPRQDGDSICVSGCGPAPGGAPPAGPRLAPEFPSYRPELIEHVKDLEARQVETDPVLRCFPPGLPRIGPPHKIVQRTGEVIFLYDDVNGSFYRIVPLDGRPHRDDLEPTYLGDAIGWWDADTLVVETVNFRDDTWLTDNGAIHTSDLRVIERLRRLSPDELEWQVTAIDPAVLTEPWMRRPRITRLTDIDIAEAPPCIERDLPHMLDGSYHANPR